MQIHAGRVILNCGSICEVDLPSLLTTDNRPIDLAVVKINTKNIEMPLVLINYSQNLEFKIQDYNPILSIVYRLVRKSNLTGNISVLEHWNYRASEAIPTTVQKINTIEPLVLNFCDSLANFHEKSFTYILQVAEIISQNATFNITNQEISGIVSHGELQ